MVRRRGRVFHRGPLPFRYVVLISFIIFSVLTIQGLMIVERGIKPTLMDIAKTETRRIATLAINEAINKRTSSELEEMQDNNDLVVTETDNEGNITSARISQRAVNQVLAVATKKVQDYLTRVQRGEVAEWNEVEGVEIETDTAGNSGIIHYIPLGQATNNSLLANLGPRVPVRFMAIGNAKTDVKSDVKLVGINNIWIDLRIHVEVNVQVVIPFATSTEVVTTDIPVILTLINGEVPQFYNNGSQDGMPSPAILPES